MQSVRKGALCLIGSSLSFAAMGVFVRLAGNLPIFEKAVFRNLFAIFISYILLLRRHIPISFPNGSRPYLLLRCISGTIGLLCNYYAVGCLNLADASILNRMSPFYVLLFSRVILKEKISFRQLIIIVIAFIGSLLVVKPSPSNLLLGPALIGALGGVAVGLANTALRRATLEGADRNVVVFLFSVFSTLICLPMTVVQFVIPSMQQLLYLTACGLCATMGQFFITAGYSSAPGREISVFEFAQVLFSAFFGFLLFNQVPDHLSIIGYLLIIGMGSASLLEIRKEDHLHKL